MPDERLQAYLERHGGEVLVTADPGLVRMLTGHTAEIDSGPSPFALPPVVIAPGDGDPVLICSIDEAPEAGLVETYEGFTTDALDAAGRAAQAMRRALAHPEIRGRRTLADTTSLPAALHALLAEPHAAGPPLLSLGATKLPGEIEAIARSIAACDSGQEAARAATEAGASELELWSSARVAIERAAGGRVPLIADLITGPRTAGVGGPPTPRAIAPGDLVLCDLVPRVDGLWGDSCATWAVNESPPADAVEVHAAATAALAAALERLRPGTAAADVDAAARGVLSAAGVECPHHIGHGVGFRWHEEPRIVPGGTTVLEEGMIVALEPGGYIEPAGVGVRVEIVAVITSERPRVMSQHKLELI